MLTRLGEVIQFDEHFFLWVTKNHQLGWFPHVFFVFSTISYSTFLLPGITFLKRLIPRCSQKCSMISHRFQWFHITWLMEVYRWNTFSLTFVPHFHHLWRSYQGNISGNACDQIVGLQISGRAKINPLLLVGNIYLHFTLVSLPFFSYCVGKYSLPGVFGKGSSQMDHGDRFRPLSIGLWDPFELAEFHGGDPNYLLTGMTLQV